MFFGGCLMERAYGLEAERAPVGTSVILPYSDML